ncbi:phage tail tube protein [Bradyrhizobium sp. 26S5]|uniref:phage tail tube protein n=1 Tax=Bradyrhizobium sp. 26S5 TaxID=3139729 RepID=UPI0030CED955
MVYQSNSAGRVAYKAQAGLGQVAAAGAGAIALPISGGSGAKLSKAATESQTIRNDGMSIRGRHGTQKTSSSYNAEMWLGSHDAIIEAIMRGTWDATPLNKTQADFTSLTTVADGIVVANGSPIDMGFKVGDIIRATNLPDAGNNGRNLRISALSSTKITVPETLIVNAAPDTNCTIARPGKRLVNPAALVRRYFGIEEFESDIGKSTVLDDFVWGTGKFSMAPNGIITFDAGGIGTGKIRPLNAGVPYFTDPQGANGTPFAVVDATIRLGGVDLVELTSFDLSLDIQPSAPDAFGSGNIKYAPDVFTGPLRVSLNLTMLRKDLQLLTDFVAETQYSLNILAVDNMAEPKDFMSITVPNFTLGGVDPSAFSNQGGGRTQTITIPPALVGIDTSATGNNSMISFQSTAA